LPLQAVRLVVSIALLIVAARMAADAISKRQADKPIEAPQAVEPAP
jgi:hypothetical protein